MIIYIADDERLALNLLNDAVSEAVPEAKTECFRKATDLLIRAREASPDIVFLDVEMPEMNGIELAEKLNKINSQINIIFVTGYREYAAEAFEVYASGYITKPCTKEDIKNAMQHLRYPLSKKDIQITTFGNFDIFFKGKPVVFRSSRSKEMLAYLVDRKGALVTRPEMAGILFEDDFSRSIQSRLTQFAGRLLEDLQEAGINGFFYMDGGYRVDLSIADCDMIDYLNGSETVSFSGEYMEQYSWGEYRKGDFLRHK